MKVVQPSNTTHSFKFIPRYYPLGTIDLYLTNETTKVRTLAISSYTATDGILAITFDFTFAERDKYSINIWDGIVVIYRGKLFATEQETQDFKVIENYFEYE